MDLNKDFLFPSLAFRYCKGGSNNDKLWLHPGPDIGGKKSNELA